VQSDDDSINDACSVISGQSDNRSYLEDVNDNDVDEVSQQEAFEEKLREAIDGLTQKSAKGRISCFHGVEKIFAIKYVPEFVDDRKVTIGDAIEKGLKKGRAEEQSSAARLSTLLCVQLGMYDSAEDVGRDLKSSLTFIANDLTASIAGRAEVSATAPSGSRPRSDRPFHSRTVYVQCCWALSMNQFFSGNDASDTLEITQLLCNIFAGSYLKGNGALATISAELAALHAAALSSWTLLLTIMAPSDIYNLCASTRACSFMP
jgi:hypothetical protein